MNFATVNWFRKHLSEPRHSCRAHTLATPHWFRKQFLSALVGTIGLTGMTPNASAQCQLQKLLAADGAADDRFGFSVAVSSDTAVIGAPLDDDLCGNCGAAYMFEKAAEVWMQTAKLTAADGAVSDVFGVSVALSGAEGDQGGSPKAVIGATGGDGLVPNAGSAYIFEKVGGVWTQTAKLTADDGAAFDLFGESVSVSGDTAVIGAFRDDNLGINSGSAYVFEKVGGVWTQTAKLTAADGAAGDFFGASVAVNSETAVIGALFDDDLGINSGSAYVFEKVAGVWTQTAKLTAADGAAVDEFGRSVALSGETAVIGGPTGDGLVPNAGSAYVFEKVGGAWTQTAKLIAADGAAGDKFGVSVAVSPPPVDTAVIGALNDDDLGTNSGAAFVFEKVRGVWMQTAKLTTADGAAGDQFGWFVAVNSDTAVSGARFDDDLGNNSGSAYVFALGPDCNRNGVPDPCDIRDGTSQDLNGNGVPDECEQGVTLDIKPGACPNPLNLKSKGVVPMAIVGSESFDVTAIDTESLVLSRADGVGGFVVPLMGPPGPGAKIEDVASPFNGELCDCQELEGDGIDDLALKFSTPELVEVLELDSLDRQMVVTLTVSGVLLDGTDFEAPDCMLIVSKAAPLRGHRSTRKLR